MVRDKQTCWWSTVAGGRLAEKRWLRVCGLGAGLLATSLLASAWRPLPDTAGVAIAREHVDWWKERHLQKLAQARALNPEIVLIGDSITHNYELSSPYAAYDFQRIWRQFYASRRTLNLGFNGDNTANALWRIEHGELDGLKPRAVVLHIGTNDTIQGRSADQTVQGIDALVEAVRRRLPDARVVVVSLLPSRVSSDKSAKDRQVNSDLARKYGSSRIAEFVDVSHLFTSDGAINVDLFMDQRADPQAAPLHPDANAQEQMAQYLDMVLFRNRNR